MHLFFFAFHTFIVTIINLDSTHINNFNDLLCSSNDLLCPRHKFNAVFKPDVQSKYSFFNVSVT